MKFEPYKAYVIALKKKPWYKRVVIKCVGGPLQSLSMPPEEDGTYPPAVPITGMAGSYELREADGMRVYLWRSAA